MLPPGSAATISPSRRRRNGRPFANIPARAASGGEALAAGDGKPGPLDAAGATTDQIEVSIGAQNRAFAQHLQAVGTAATVDLYGAGTHNWVYWQRELHRAWPLLTADLLR